MTKIINLVHVMIIFLFLFLVTINVNAAERRTCFTPADCPTSDCEPPTRPFCAFKYCLCG
uniref:Nodule-specific cysteine-rich peptide L08 n=1 Tax=Lens culinaris TaxID=3864 RepID=A0A7T8DV66_LENCU|nr:nodule-specific cysteine-rich peptide L08 [Lens culinaris]